MLYCLVEREKEGGKQLNRVEMPFTIACRGWESIRLLLESGDIPAKYKTLNTKYKYICEYEKEDWEQEEKAIVTNGEYLL